MPVTNEFSYFLVSTIKRALVKSLRLFSPENVVKSALRVSSCGSRLTVQGHSYPLKRASVHVVAFGKAAASMVEGAEAVLGDSLAGGIASVPFGSRFPTDSKIDIRPGAKNNLPDETAMETTSLVERYLGSVPKEHLVLFLVSGGGSALLPAPIAGISLQQKLDVIAQMTRNGAPIQELNAVRIALSRVKGGRLARMVPGQGVSLIISDIIGDPIDLIASGPTVAPIVALNPVAVAQKYNKTNTLPSNVLSVLQSYVPVAPNSAVQNTVVASNKLLMDAFVEQLRTTFSCESEFCNVDVEVVSTTLSGDASIVAKDLFERARHNGDPTSMEWHVDVFAGETTVQFPDPVPEGAVGGRNQEMALAFLRELIRETKATGQTPCTGLLCVGTDGQDGPTDAAGAFVSSEEVAHLSSADLRRLEDRVVSDLTGKRSWRFWHEYRAGRNHVKLGKTGHNLMDVYALFYRRNRS